MCSQPDTHVLPGAVRRFNDNLQPEACRPYWRTTPELKVFIDSSTAFHSQSPSLLSIPREHIVSIMCINLPCASVSCTPISKAYVTQTRKKEGTHRHGHYLQRQLNLQSGPQMATLDSEWAGASHSRRDPCKIQLRTSSAVRVARDERVHIANGRIFRHQCTKLVFEEPTRIIVNARYLRIRLMYLAKVGTASDPG